MNLTRKDIESDIEAYERRIATCQETLDSLPPTAPTYQERKKLLSTRNRTQGEIYHVKRLLGYAREALVELEVMR